MKNFNGFTLAEVLITIGVIGVVAAITIPALMHDTQDKDLRTSFKSIYSDITHATQLIQLDNGGTLANSFSGISDARDKYAEKLKVVKTCNNSATDGCWANTWYEFGTGVSHSAPNLPGLQLSNGAYLIFEDYFSSSCDSSGSNVSTNTTLSNVCSDMVIDVNGPKMPNKIGRDIFYVWILSNGLIPWGTNSEKTGAGTISNSSTCAVNQGGWGCGAKVLNDTNY